ncbi:hypothetical protein EW026_g2852 [Hermanssonia centrifuga]|uniref:Uncharacterized protein n=1 Tax=Hermanssonia centrifuga TaxID=98765 RepID=A0A4S4KLZ7_9APHY|nr:hypothetical protein EW026_g2852 [Hermanssonia centrifuga]
MVASASILVNAPSEVELQPEVDSRVIHFEHDDQPLPVVDVQPLINAAQLVYTPDSDVNTVSVDVMAIVGTTASAITIDPNIFYDSELLAIIHRSKAKSSGLVATKVWAWQGIKSKLGESEERKLQELARRYNTSLIVTKQFGEPSELVYTLGGQLAIRQGIRAHWSSENTAMHLVRAFGGVTYIDELDLSIKNLCSGFSYCISLLQTFYVWHGRGATDVERHAALKYAQSLAPSASDIIELVEGESDEDEMFWLILGEGEYAKADYWRWKATSDHWQARIWMVNGDQADSVLLPLASISNAVSPHSHIFILDCVWEYFVLVGSEARGKRKDIRIALNVASETATKIASSRPYSPTVHVLILPSQLPADLRLAFRDFDETQLNQGLTPDHLNLLPVSLAKDHLQQTLWQRDLLTDSTILPLGLDVPQ